MVSEHVKKYLDRIESQHKSSIRYMTHVEKLLELIDGAYEAIHEAPDKFNIETAEGLQLDIVGRRVGAYRNDFPGSNGGIMTDDEYRLYIYAQIFKNHWDGTNEEFQIIWNNTLGKIMDSSFTDNQDMTIDLIVYGHIGDTELSMITNSNIVPRPMGVRYNYKNRLPDANGRVQIYIGLAMYCSQFQSFNADEAPDFDDVDFLADGLGDVLYDGFGVVLTC